jgi:hypothetical protein
MGQAAFKSFLQQDIEGQEAALLVPMIQQIIRRENRALGNRLAALLVRGNYEIGQTRRLVTNVLNIQLDQLGIPDDDPAAGINTLLTRTADSTKQDLRRRAAHLEELVELNTTPLTDEEAS